MTRSSRGARASRRLAGAVMTAALLANFWSGHLPAQQPAAPLAAADRIAIHQLVARYSYAMDDAIDDGAMLASLFLPDGVLIVPEATVTGRPALAAFVRERRTPAWTATLVTNLVVEGAGDRASGRVYVLEVRGDDQGGAGTLSTGGLFLDRYVRTPDGWRFARREFTRSRLAGSR